MTTKDIYLAGGCFWGTEHFFKQIAGVVSTEVGFANGHTANPTYEQVYTDTTGYAETVKVVYNPSQVTLEFLLRMFFVAIDPTSLNKQGHDEGTRYRTGIYYTDAADRTMIDKVFAEEQSKYAEPLVVEREPLTAFYTADEYHQDYLDKHPDGYCHLPKALFEMARNANRKWQQSIKTGYIMLQIGDKMPAFSVADEQGRAITDKDLLGKKTVIYFYPKDSTPGCSAEACNIRDNYQSFMARGYQVFGVSKDSQASHIKFKEKYALPFPLLSDPTTEMLQAFGAWGEKKLYGKSSMGTLRKTFIFDENGILERIIEKVDTKNHSAQIL